MPARLNRLETHLERQAELSVRSSMAKDKRRPPCFFFREAWDLFFLGAMSVFEDEQLEGKGSHLKR